MLVAASRARATLEKDFMVMMLFGWVIRCVKVWGIQGKMGREIENRDGEENKVLLGFNKGSYRDSPGQEGARQIEGLGRGRNPVNQTIGSASSLESSKKLKRECGPTREKTLARVLVWQEETTVGGQAQKKKKSSLLNLHGNTPATR
jgi:hypothetical protein